MIVAMARLLLKGGIAMLILCLLIRPAIHTPNGLMGDNLAIIACLALIATTLLYIRFGPKDDDKPAGRPKSSHSPKHP
ncbi:hypothetical protein [Microlunatus soli]|uniref:Uncharacterized protein n=1 Tax=Microlunatus soli TaxID=630515 RepID=A0A1H1W4E5_9ACTN|nr:hypothetical protein [Microlunatus soli]SDS91590.1 hypothetical protein SAMN04489812_3474 [Microlunatus soli]